MKVFLAPDLDKTFCWCLTVFVKDAKVSFYDEVFVKSSPQAPKKFPEQSKPPF